MRLFRQLTFAAAFLVADAAFAGQGRISVEVQTGSWGDASVSDIRSVLQSVVDVLAPHLPKQAGRIIVAYSPIGPRVLPRRSADDPHLVFLKVQDRRWDQFAYQFSHEFCHIFSNHDRRPMGAAYGSREHQWFEETLCEVVSLVTLNRLASSWRESPPRAGVCASVQRVCGPAPKPGASPHVGKRVAARMVSPASGRAGQESILQTGE